MGSHFSISARKLCVAAVAALCVGTILFAQSTGANEQKSDPNLLTRLRIEVTAGEKSDPLGMASVYVRYVVKHSKSKDDSVEMNIKTNKEGVAIANDVPRGNVLVQVIADGWKTFGQWYVATDGQQTIKIHLEKPPRWF